MNILFLCKRRYTNKDVIVDKYGRLYEIPEQLSKQGCKLTCICLSYYRAEELSLDTSASIKWSSYNWYSWIFMKYLFSVIKAVRHDKPSLIIASSDVPHIIFGWIISRIHGIKFVADLYDNYESYGLSKIPFFKPLFRRSLRQADYILTVSEALNRHVFSITVTTRS